MNEAPLSETTFTDFLVEEKKVWDEIGRVLTPQGEVILEPQVTILAEIPEAEKIADVTERPWHKPTGGLWTSTLDEEGGEWLRWLYGEGYSLEMPRWGGKMWRLVPKSANLYVLLSPADLYALVERYPHELTRRASDSPFDSMRMLVDWPLMSQDYDGVHVPNPWPWRFGHGQDLGASMFFYSMDAECTCWFRWCFEEEPVELDPTPYLAKLKEGRE